MIVLVCSCLTQQISCMLKEPFVCALIKVHHVSSIGPNRDGTIGEDTIRASLVSAVSDKLRWRMKEEMDRAQAELDALKRTEEDLKKGHQKLEEMVSRLDQEVVRHFVCVSVCVSVWLSALFHATFFHGGEEKDKMVVDS